MVFEKRKIYITRRALLNTYKLKRWHWEFDLIFHYRERERGEREEKKLSEPVILALWYVSLLSSLYLTLSQPIPLFTFFGLPRVSPSFLFLTFFLFHFLFSIYPLEISVCLPYVVRLSSRYFLFHSLTWKSNQNLPIHLFTDFESSR